MNPRSRRPWTRPFLRWAGSKRSILSILLDSAPQTFGRYVEPFVGSGCLFFALRPSTALLGDINAELIDVYETVRDHPRLVVRSIMALGDGRSYYKIRRQPVLELSTVERAARFIYLNRYGFNGVFRTNRLDEYNVPRGQKISGPPTEVQLYRCAVALRTATLKACDFEESISQIRSGDFVYLDPPFSYAKRHQYGQYGYGAFQDIDIPRLVKALKRINAIGATFLLSYRNSANLVRQLSFARCKRIDVRRQVAGFGRHRRHTKEVLLTNAAVY